LVGFVEGPPRLARKRSSDDLDLDVPLPYEIYREVLGELYHGNCGNYGIYGISSGVLENLIGNFS
jgi:hypothetical protein